MLRDSCDLNGNQECPAAGRIVPWLKAFFKTLSTIYVGTRWNIQASMCKVKLFWGKPHWGTVCIFVSSLVCPFLAQSLGCLRLDFVQHHVSRSWPKGKARLARFTSWQSQWPYIECHFVYFSYLMCIVCSISLACALAPSTKWHP